MDYQNGNLLNNEKFHRTNVTCFTVEREKKEKANILHASSEKIIFSSRSTNFVQRYTFFL